MALLWLSRCAAKTQHIAGLLRSVCMCSLQSLPSNLFIFLLSVAVAQRPSVSDSMLTTLQKAPKKRLGLAVRFPISHRRTRSWTQLMANNYQGNFTMTASEDFIRGKEGAACCGVPLQTNTFERHPLPLPKWLDAGISLNLCLSISKKWCWWRWMCVPQFSHVWGDKSEGESSWCRRLRSTSHSVWVCMSACHASPRALPHPPCLLSHYIDCGKITVSKFTMLTALTKGPAAAFWCPLGPPHPQAGPRGAPFHISNVRWCYLRVTSNPQTRSLFHRG